jgi:hypothetical protein
MFVSKATSRLTIYLFDIQDSVPELPLAWFMFCTFIYFPILVPNGSLVEVEMHNMLFLNS